MNHVARKDLTQSVVKAAPSVDDEDEDEPRVSMSNRALPLINLLTAAAREGSDVMWK